jgi:hypothetical protein
LHWDESTCLLEKVFLLTIVLTHPNLSVLNGCSDVATGTGYRTTSTIQTLFLTDRKTPDMLHRSIVVCHEGVSEYAMVQWK